LVLAVIAQAAEDLAVGRASRDKNEWHERDMKERLADARHFFCNGRLPSLLRVAGLSESVDPDIVRERAYRQAGIPFRRINGKVVAL
jgi:hypothetical protein